MRRPCLLATALLLAACRPAEPPGRPAEPPPPAATAVTPLRNPAPDLESLRLAEDEAAAITSMFASLCAALREHDESALARAMASEVQLALPSPADQGEEMGPVRSRAWVPAGPFLKDASPTLARRTVPEAAADLAAFGARWPVIESCRVEVTDLHPSGSGSIELRLVGISAEGRHEGLAATGRFRIVSVAGVPRLSSLWLRGSSVIARRDIATDVSVAAGVERPDPSLIDRGGRGLVSHGAAAADADGDGLVDVFAAGHGQHALFRNRGDGTFEDVAEAARIATSSSPACAPLFLDADGDGDQDLFLSGVGKQSLFENRLVPDGKLAFRDVSDAAGVAIERAAFSAAAGDVNGDGRPDILVACYGDYGNVVPDSWTGATNGQPNLLFLNEGGLRFREAAAGLGLADARWSYAALLADMDDDADLDAVVANDFGAATGLFVNEGGRFRDAAAERGLGAPSYGMGLSLGDPDRDGDLDLHVTKASSPAVARMLGRAGGLTEDARALAALLASGNTLERRQPDGTFRTFATMPTGWSWGGGFVDLDSDGWTDLFVPGGFLTGAGAADTDDLYWRQVIESLHPQGRSKAAFFAEQVPLIVDHGASFAGNERDAVFLNAGDGAFVDVSGASGLDSPTDGRAAVFADFDDDGDPDVFLRAMHSRAHLLFRNEIGQDARSVRIALRGTASGPDACGAIVRVRRGGRVTAQAKLCGSGFLSQSDPRLLFGLGDGERIDGIEVAWPSGARQAFPGAPAGTSWLLVEGEPEPRSVPERRVRLGGT